jgi:hypothetical protein
MRLPRLRHLGSGTPAIGLGGSVLLCASMVWAAHATPLTITAGSILRELSPIEKIGCERSGLRAIP